MKHSKTEDMDGDYWVHAKPNVHWDHKCRIKHGEPTWYYSFMGRKEKMEDFNKNKKKIFA